MLFFFPTIVGCFKKFSNFFFRFGFWAEGLGVNAQKTKHIIGLFL